MSRVRDALVTSVKCSARSRSFAPPVRFQISHVSIVPASSSPFSARCLAFGTLSRVHAHFGAAGYELCKSPVLRRYFAASPSWFVRVSCQTMAL